MSGDTFQNDKSSYSSNGVIWFIGYTNVVGDILYSVNCKTHCVDLYK